MNKKLRIFLCSLISVLMIFTVAFIGCDSDPSNSSSSSDTTSSTTDSGSDAESHTHSYDYENATITWSSDYTSATVTVPCSVSGCTESITIEAKNITITSTEVAATNTTAGSITYKATFTVDSKEYSFEKKVDVPAKTTVYDAYYLDLESEGSIAEGTQLFGGAVTTVGSTYWYANVNSETDVTSDDIAEGYTFLGRLFLSKGSSITLTLADEADITLYLGMASDSATLSITNTSTNVTTNPTTDSTDPTTLAVYDTTLDAGTYSISSSSYMNIYAIMLKGTGYTAGVYNYSEKTSSGDESGDQSGTSTAGALAIGENTISVTETDEWGYTEAAEYTFTADADGYYTFSIDENADADVYVGSANIYKGSSTSTTIYLAKDEEIEIEANTYSYDTAEYILVIDYSTTATATPLTVDETISPSLVSTLDGYTYYATFSIADLESGYIKLGGSNWSSMVSSISVTLNGATVTASEDNANVYEFANLTGNDTVVITFNTTSSYFSYSASNIKVTLSEGTYTAITTNIPTLDVADNTIAIGSDVGTSGTNATFTVPSEGVYTFSIPSGSDATVKITINDTTWTTLYGSSSSPTASCVLKTTDTVTINFRTTSTDEGTYTFTIARKDLEYQTVSSEYATELSLYGDTSSTSKYNAYISYTPSGESTTYIQFSITTNNSSGIPATATIGDNSYEITNNVLTLSGLTSGTEYKIVLNYTGLGSSTVNNYDFYAIVGEDKTLSVPDAEALTLGSDGNTITLSAYYAWLGYDISYTGLTNGTYSISVTGSNIYVGVGSYDYWSGGYSYTLTDTNTTIESYTVSNGTLSLSFYTANGLAGTYTLTVTLVEAAEEEQTEEGDLSFGENSISITAEEANSGITHKYVVAVEGYYTVSIADATGSTENLNAYIEVSVGGSKATVLGNTIFTWTFTDKLTANTVISFVYYALDETNASACVLTITDVASGTELGMGANSLSLTADEASTGVTYTYTIKADGNYTFTITEYSNVWMKIYATSTYNPDATFGYSMFTKTVTLEAGDVVTVTYEGMESGTASSCVLTISRTESVKTSVPETLEDGDNTITLSSSDAWNYYYQDYTLAAGNYTFTVTGDDVYVVIDYGSYSYLESNGDSCSFKLTSETTVSFTFSTSSGSEGSYTLSMTVTAIVEDADGYYNISTIGNDGVDDDYITLTTDASTNSTKGTWSGTDDLDANVDLTASLMLYTGSSTKYVTLTVVADSEVTFYYAGLTDITISYGESGSYTLTATGDTGSVSAVTLSLSAGVTYTLTCSGTTTNNARIYAIVVVPDDSGTTTTIVSVDFTTYTSNTLSTTGDADWENLTLSDGTDTGFDVIGKLATSTTDGETTTTETVASIKTQNSVMSLNFGGGLSYTAATEDGGEPTVSSALRYYLEAGTYTVTVSYFGPASTESENKSGRYAIVVGSDGKTLSGTVTDSEKTGSDQTIVTRTMEITVTEDGYIYIGSASSGLYITAISITQTVTTAAE